jgi:protein TonB
VASAVDTRRSSASSSANSAKSRGVGSPAGRNNNPVALEVQVIATGARPGDSDSQRELFTEETTTVLVFESGAVIRLTAAVAAGQLLFLTNKESRREVVAQVTRKRDFRPTNCYVEVEFSEPAPGFWGLEFPEHPELVPANAQQQEAAELVQASRTIADKPSESAPAPSAQEVEALKEEVEKLRKQLESLQTKTATGNASAPAATAPPCAAPTSASPAAQTAAQPEASSKPSATPSEAPAGLSSAAPRVVPAPPALRQNTTSFEDKPFPKPEIRINRGTSAFERPGNPKSASSGRVRPPTVRISLLTAALLLVATSVAWYRHWIPQLPFSKKHSPKTSASTMTRPAPIVNSAPQKLADAHTDSATQTVGAPASPPSAPQSAPAEAAKPSALLVLQPPARSDAASEVPAIEQKSTITPAVVKHPVPRSSGNPSEASATPISEGPAFIPPKLIKSVRAVASPNALPYFDKSNTAIVTLNALVDSSGHVKSMKVLSGPASLREAAIGALKQYRYAPARQLGKPVPAHVTVTINFLFEP